MEIVNRNIERYIEETEGRSHEVLQDMERYAASRAFPIIGPSVGRLLSILTRSSGARRILELGSGFGYSAFWFAMALPEDGEIICTELSEENTRRGIGYLERGGLAGKVTYRTEGGLAVARELAESSPESFDILFNDIDKEWYGEVPPLAKRLLKHGGLFITDNSLWGGSVLMASSGPATSSRLSADTAGVPPDTAGVLELNRLTTEDPEFETSILPIRDGLTVACRLC
jgi:predicted O-methyltransferase YrrM